MTLYHKENYDSMRRYSYYFFSNILKSCISQNSVTEFKSFYADINSKIV